MRAIDVIARKRDGLELSESEIRWFISGTLSGSVADYQTAAWLMAIYLRGMTRDETVVLTKAMAESGRLLDLGAIASRSVDKHSSGGVGDKTSLVVGPLAAAAGVIVPKMSGRGLGFTGGTLDKLESIPGFRVNLSTEQIVEQAQRVGLVIASQSADLAPADGKLYALRDVTATVGSLPLIVSSILSKKLAAGAPSIVLDVKGGSGAFMRTIEDAEVLARSLVDVGVESGRRVVAFVTRMDQPLGRAVGNAVEVREAIETLQGNGPPDLVELSLTLASEMVMLAGIATTEGKAREAVERALETGAGLAKLREMIAAQGGDPKVVDDPSRLPTASIVKTIRSPKCGSLLAIDAETIGQTMTALGAGREKKGDPVDHRIGVIFHRKVGDDVAVGDPLFTLQLTDPQTVGGVRDRIMTAYKWSERPVTAPSIVSHRIAAR